MRHLKFFTVTVILGLQFYSCDNCGSLECAPNDYEGQFRIVSAIDGKDLVFGPTRIYDKDQIRFYSLNGAGADTNFFDYQPMEYGGAGYDSILQVLFLPKVNIAYMRLSNGDVDTFNITYTDFDTKCCGTVTEITTLRLNNSVNIPGNIGPQEIRK
jgi:hypothetical protein